MTRTIRRLAKRLKTKIALPQAVTPPKPPEPPEKIGRRVLKTPEAAEYLGMSASTLHKMRCTGAGPVYSLLGMRGVVYEVEQLDAWVESRRRRSTSEPR